MLFSLQHTKLQNTWVTNSFHPLNKPCTYREQAHTKKQVALPLETTSDQPFAESSHSVWSSWPVPGVGAEGPGGRWWCGWRPCCPWGGTWAVPWPPRQRLPLAEPAGIPHPRCCQGTFPAPVHAYGETHTHTWKYTHDITHTFKHTHVKTHPHTHICTHTYTPSHTHTHAHTHTCTHTHTHTHTHTCTYTHTHTHTHIHAHVHTHTQCTHIHTCTHTHTLAPTHTSTQQWVTEGKQRWQVRRQNLKSLVVLFVGVNF